MFEDRSRRRKSNTLIVIFLVIFLAAAIGLFFNSGNQFFYNKTDKPNNKSNKINSYQIPDDLVKMPQNTIEPTKPISNIPGESLITPNTVLVFEVDFQLCGHSKMKKSIQSSADEINLNEEQFQQKYKDWKITSFEPEKVVLKKILNTYCPDHFIIGVKGEKIVVYKYNIDGQKILIDETDVQITTLTPEDQEIIRSGIVVDTEDELQSILEGFSD